MAAAVIALTLTATGAAGYAAASLTRPQTLLVEPGVVYMEETAAEAVPEQAEEPASPALIPEEEAPAAKPAEEAEEPAAEAPAVAGPDCSEPADEPVTEAPEAPEAPAETAEEAPAPEAEPEAAPAPEAAPETAPADEAPAPELPALPEEALGEENGLTAVWQEMTDELAAEDPLAARYEVTSLTPDESGLLTLTPEELNAMLDTQQIDWDEENCLSWFFNWLYKLFFPGRGNSSYSGWRTEGGRTYYYDRSTHERLTGLQTIDDKIYYFNDNGVLQENVTFGIDVSRYQQSVNWSKVKAAGASFAIIRIGYRGYETGALVLDSMFENHLAGARAAGLKVGVYIFSQAVNEDEAREEAFACSYVLDGRKLDYPVYFDSEYATSSHNGRADGLSKAERTACAVAFCEELKKYGYEPGVYASTSWFRNHLELSALQGYSIWNAHYGVGSPSIDCDLWQGSCTGSLSGVSSSGVDLNISYIG